jgi:hypothetical protein
MSPREDDDPFKRPEGQPIARAIKAFREGRPSDEKCFFCGGKIVVVGVPPENPTFIEFVCPCGKSSGRLHGI